jgi:hypothetical protein
VSAVFPLPLGPTIRNVGNVFLLVEDRYSNICIITGRNRATVKEKRITDNFGSSKAVNTAPTVLCAMANEVLNESEFSF